MLMQNCGGIEVAKIEFYVDIFTALFQVGYKKAKGKGICNLSYIWVLSTKHWFAPHLPTNWFNICEISHRLERETKCSLYGCGNLSLVDAF